MLEKIFESPLDCKKIQPGLPEGNQFWIFIGRTDVEAETPTLWPPDVKNGLIRKNPDVGKDWGQEKGMTEDEMVGWHHRLSGLEFELVLDSEPWRAAVSPWVRRVRHDWATELNWTEPLSQKDLSKGSKSHPKVILTTIIININPPTYVSHHDSSLGLILSTDLTLNCWILSHICTFEVMLHKSMSPSP